MLFFAQITEVFMSNHISDEGPSIRSGALVIEFMPSWPWPNAEDSLVASQFFRDGRAYLHALTSGKIQLTVADINSNILLQAETCHLEMPERYSLTVGVSWDLPNRWSFYINGQSTGSSDEQKSSVLLERKNSSSHVREDFSTENQNALTRRREKLAGAADKAGRIKNTQEEIRKSVLDEILQIQDLITLVKSGEKHHLKGLSARIRLLIAMGKPLPLLQLYAAMTEKPLIVYTDQRPSRVLPYEPWNSFSISIWDEPTDDDINPIDLDVWLDLKVSQRIDKSYQSHRVTLRDIGDTIGAHLDLYRHPTIPAFEAVNSELTGDTLTFMEAYLIQIASTSIGLAKKLVQEYR